MESWQYYRIVLSRITTWLLVFFLSLFQPIPISVAEASSPVQISNVTIDAISKSMVRIYWDTNVPANTKILYGRTSAYGKEAFEGRNTKTTTHQWFISGLAPNTTYHFCPQSEDVSGNKSVCDGSINDFTFTTLPDPNGDGLPEEPELPREYVDTSMPTMNGRILQVNPENNCTNPTDGLQAMIDQAQGGDTIEIPAGTVCHGNFKLPKRTANDNEWIIIRTSTPDDQLPPPGNRIHPSDKHLLATLEVSGFHLSWKVGRSQNAYCDGVDYGGLLIGNIDPTDSTSPIAVWRCIDPVAKTAAIEPYATGLTAPDTCTPGEWFYKSDESHYNKRAYRCIRPNEYVQTQLLEWPEPANAIWTEKGGAHHYRLIGLDLTHTPHPEMEPDPLWDQSRGRAPGSFHSLLVRLEDDSHHIIFDRNYIHGHGYPSRVMGGINSNAKHWALIDSYIENIDMWNRGRSYENIGVAIGTAKNGPAKIVNNYIDAIGITLFAVEGAPPYPHDYEVRGNYFYKNRKGLMGGPESDGLGYWNRHLFELKSGHRWLVEGNIFDGNWSVNQQGAHLTLSTRSPSGRNDNFETEAGIKDITIQNNIFRNGTHVFAFLGHDDYHRQGNPISKGMKRVKIHNNLIYGFDGFKWQSAGNGIGATGRGGIFLSILNGMEDLIVTHNTVYDNKGVWPHNLISFGVSSNLLYRDNLIKYNDPYNRAPFAAANNLIGEAALDASWTAGDNPAWLAENNVFLMNRARQQTIYTHPVGQFWPLDEAEIQFEDVSNLTELEKNNYALKSTSPYAGAATDGKDIGVVMDELNVAIKNTEKGNRSGVASNQAPLVNAGVDQTITLPNDVSLVATVSDDGLPSGTLRYTWSKISGPGTVTFADASLKDTTASFDQAGVYQLRLTVDDGARIASNDLLVTVNAAPSVPPGPGIVGQWDFDGSSTNQAGSGTANVRGAQFVAGRGGEVLSFDGNDSVEISDSVFNNITNGMTISIWSKSSRRGQAVVAAMGDSRGFGLFSGKVWYVGSGSDFHGIASGSGADNQWHMYTLTWDGSASSNQLKTYRDGQLVAQRNMSSLDMSRITSGKMVLGQDNRNGGFKYQGELDELRVYDRALTSQEVQNLASGVPSTPPANRAPVASNVAVTTAEATAIATALSVTDADRDTLTYQVVTQPTNGTLSGTAPNLTYTPNGGFTGNDTFTYRANDGTVDSNTATVTITVRAAGAAPPGVVGEWDFNGTSGTANVRGAQFVAGRGGEVLSFDGNDSVEISDSVFNNITNGMTISIWSKSSRRGQAVVAAMGDSRGFGLFSGKVWYVGSGSDFHGIASGSGADNQWHMYTLTWDGSASSNQLKTYRDGQLVAQRNMSSLDMSRITSGKMVLGQDNRNGGFKYQGELDELRVYDRALTSQEVQNLASGVPSTPPANRAPVASNVAVTTAEATAIATALSVTDADRDTLTYQVVTQPTNGTLSGTAPNLTYTPNGGFTGNDTFTYRANDGTVDSNTATVTITVRAAGAAPPGVVGEWDFNGTSGTANVRGAQFVAGRGGEVLSFDGNDSVEISDSVFNNITNGMTISIWSKSSRRGQAVVAAMGDSRGFGLFSGKVWYVGSGSDFHGIASGSGADNQWHMYTLTWDGSASSNQLKTYRDGQLVAQRNMSSLDMSRITSGKMVLGQDNRNGQYRYTGEMDDLKVYNRALTQQEINNLMNS